MVEITDMIKIVTKAMTGMAVMYLFSRDGLGMKEEEGIMVATDHLAFYGLVAIDVPLKACIVPVIILNYACFPSWQYRSQRWWIPIGLFVFYRGVSYASRKE